MNVLRGAKNYVTGALGLGFSGETRWAVTSDDLSFCLRSFLCDEMDVLTKIGAPTTPTLLGWHKSC